MTRYTLALLYLFLLTSPAVAWQDRDARPPGRLIPQTSGVTSSLRGICAVSDRVAWASGADATCLRTTDRGAHWEKLPLPGDPTSDYRDIHALDSEHAVLMSVGSPARILRTTDGGRHWHEVYRNEHPQIFLDGMAFWDPQHGLAFGDPIDGRIVLLMTSDGGATWTEPEPEMRPPAAEGEAGFAASGTALCVMAGQHAWIGLGGATTTGRARVWRSDTFGRDWQSTPTPVASSESAGIFSIAFRDTRHGVAAGGDYRQPDAAAVAVTTDGGRTWVMPNGQAPRGYRSAVAAVPGTDPPLWIATGTNGTDYSQDDGHHWLALDDAGFHALSFTSGAIGWAVGSDGRIARFER